MRTLINKINTSEILIVRVLLAAIVALVFAYLYFVNNTAFSAAAYERISSDIVDIQSEIGEKELVYIEKNSNIDRSMYAEFGLVATAESNLTFTKRNVATKLSFNE